MSRFDRKQEFTDRLDSFALGALIWGSIEIDEKRIRSVLKMPKDTSEDSFEDGCSELYLSEQFPPKLSELVHDCTAVEASKRPSCEEVMDRISKLMKEPWAEELVFRNKGCSQIPWICAAPPPRQLKIQEESWSPPSNSGGEAEVGGVGHVSVSTTVTQNMANQVEAGLPSHFVGCMMLPCWAFRQLLNWMGLGRVYGAGWFS